MAIVDDFKSIHELMKGELKAQPKEPSLLCPLCKGTKRIPDGSWSGMPMVRACPDCDPVGLSFPKGISPNMPPAPASAPPVKHHLLCFDCNGMGHRSGKMCNRCNGLGIEP